LETYRKQIHGIIHATGGGQTKCLKFAQNVHIIKDNLFPVPEVFRLIQATANTSWEEMYRTFNMGCRMELYTEPNIAEELIARAQAVGIPAQIIGRVESSPDTRLTIETGEASYLYLAEV
jgi:phosphoribosylformylglycinamidine cyclo-ligase